MYIRSGSAWPLATMMLGKTKATSFPTTLGLGTQRLTNIGPIIQMFVEPSPTPHFVEEYSSQHLTRFSTFHHVSKCLHQFTMHANVVVIWNSSTSHNKKTSSTWILSDKQLHVSNIKGGFCKTSHNLLVVFCVTRYHMSIIFF